MIIPSTLAKTRKMRLGRPKAHQHEFQYMFLICFKTCLTIMFNQCELELLAKMFENVPVLTSSVFFENLGLLLVRIGRPGWAQLLVGVNWGFQFTYRDTIGKNWKSKISNHGFSVAAVLARSGQFLSNCSGFVLDILCRPFYRFWVLVNWGLPIHSTRHY